MCVAVCGYVHVSGGPAEARGGTLSGCPGAGAAGNQELSGVGVVTEVRSSEIVASALNHL